jgi:hypothetical protein
MRRSKQQVYHCTVVALILLLIVSCGPAVPQEGKSVHSLSLHALYPETQHLSDRAQS